MARTINFIIANFTNKATLVWADRCESFHFTGSGLGEDNWRFCNDDSTADRDISQRDCARGHGPGRFSTGSLRAGAFARASTNGCPYNCKRPGYGTRFKYVSSLHGQPL
jgi:hypothetical protein